MTKQADCLLRKPKIVYCPECLKTLAINPNPKAQWAEQGGMLHLKSWVTGVQG